MARTRWLIAATAALVVLPTALWSQKESGTANGAGVRRSGYAGSQVCADCHQEEYAAFPRDVMGKVLMKQPRTEHEKLGCESCHGPGQQHAESGGDQRGALVTFDRKSPVKLEVRNAACLECHQGSGQMWWKGSNHENRGVACSDCHSAHAATGPSNLQKTSTVETCGACHQQQQASQMRFAHMPIGERKLECSSCHNPHGSPNPKMLLATSSNEACFTCHAEKRGPFLWNHAPVTENCANCHDAHGSSQPKMLRVSMPRLCQQCHAGATRHPTAGRENNAVNAQHVTNRACTNCHVTIHGSNHPSGFAFIR